ncbi:MAG TPA: hypothetical protein EYP79_01215 [Campylobacterales bacterium]|nr:hypothetical protein [Campylobacterales bacterium]
MKKLATSLFLALFAISFSFASSVKGEFEKKGFLTTKWCAQNGFFVDCRLETYHCAEEGCYKNWLPGDEVKTDIVLYVHEEGKIYLVKPEGVHVSELLEKAANRNEVTIIGELSSDGKTIKAYEFKAPPPPKKSFFKGCL